MIDKRVTRKGIEYRIDMYRSVYISTTSIHRKIDDMSVAMDMIKDSIEEWEQMSVKAVWVRVHVSHSEMVKVLHDEMMFTVHHAKEDYIMMVRWMMKDRESNLPVYNTHVCGAGGIVIDPIHMKVLLVHEKSPIGRKIWKLPGGQLDSNEYVGECVVREVKEETGVDSKYIGLMGMREMKNYRFGASDIYFICLLEADSTKPLSVDRSEVDDVRWWSISEYLSSKDESTPSYMLIKDIISYIHRMIIQRKVSPLASLYDIVHNNDHNISMISKDVSLKIKHRTIPNMIHYNNMIRNSQLL